MDDKSLRSMGRPLGGALFLLALAIRSAHVFGIRRLPSFAWPYEGLDADLYGSLARAIARGDLFPRGIADAAPLYAYWLAGIGKIAGQGPLAPRLLQAGFGAAAALLIGAVAARVAGRKAGVVAGLGAALYPPFVMAEGTLQSAALVPFLGALLLALLMRARSRPAAAFGAGIALGASALNRPDLLPLALPLAAWLFLSPARLRGTLLFLAGMALLVAPFSVRNSMTAGGFVPVTSHGGIHFFLGNHRGADGTLAPVEGIRSTPEGFARDARTAAIKETGRDMTRAEVSRFWFRKGLAELAADPARAAALLVRKAYLFVNDYEIPNNEDLYFLRRYSPVLRFPFPLFGAVCAFGLYGLAFGRFREGAKGMLGIVALTGLTVALLFFVTGRYRLPALPALIVLAGGGAAAWAGHLRSKRPVAALILPLLLLSHAPAHRLDFAGPEARLGSSWLRSGDLTEAEAAYRRALEIRPGFPDAMRGLARVHQARGETDEAARIYDTLAASGRDGRIARNDRATLLAGAGRTDEALGILRSLVEEDPGDPFALANLGALHFQTGEDSLAAEYLGRAIRADSELADPYLNLGLLRARQGRLDEAVALFRRHVGLDPESGRGLYNLGVALAREGDLDGAIRVWERLRAIDPAYPRLGASLARARLMKQQEVGERH
ncbi:MAG: tetratricopeptide repeat protein [Candidatus Eisenbacteria bacterium]